MSVRDDVRNDCLKYEKIILDLGEIMSWADARLGDVAVTLKALREELACEEMECGEADAELKEQRREHIFWLKNELKDNDQLLVDLRRLVVFLEDFILKSQNTLARMKEKLEKRKDLP